MRYDTIVCILLSFCRLTSNHDMYRTSLALKSNYTTIYLEVYQLCNMLCTAQDVGGYCGFKEVNRFSTETNKVLSYLGSALCMYSVCTPPPPFKTHRYAMYSSTLHVRVLLLVCCVFACCCSVRVHWKLSLFNLFSPPGVMTFLVVVAVASFLFDTRAS